MENLIVKYNGDDSFGAVSQLSSNEFKSDEMYGEDLGECSVHVDSNDQMNPLPSESTKLEDQVVADGNSSSLESSESLQSFGSLITKYQGDDSYGAVTGYSNGEPIGLGLSPNCYKPDDMYGENGNLDECSVFSLDLRDDPYSTAFTKPQVSVI